MKLRNKILAIPLSVLLAGFLIPEKVVIPVKGANTQDWNKDSYWYEPWGSSGVHKGIDIFASKGTDLVSTTGGIVLFHGNLSKGGKVVLILGPKWRFHYYAHLDSINISSFTFVSPKQKIGTVGDSGNAKGKPAHLHYSIISAVPYPWKVTTESQGWKKMFFLDPGKFINS